MLALGINRAFFFNNLFLENNNIYSSLWIVSIGSVPRGHTIRTARLLSGLLCAGKL
jgi:hypothetical protein